MAGVVGEVDLDGPVIRAAGAGTTTLVVDHPARGRAQQLRDLAVAVAAVPAGELDDVGGEPLLVVPAPRELAPRRAMPAECSAHPALGGPKLPSDVLDAGAAPRGAQ